MKITQTILILLKTSGLLTLALSFSAVATVDIGLAESLRQELEAQGWQAEEAADGSLIYRRTSIPDQQKGSLPESRTLSGDDLNHAMRQRGWQMEWDASGNLLLRMDKEPQQTQDKGVEQAAPEAARGGAEVSPAHAGFEYWRIERQSDGSLHFHPLEKDSSQLSPVESLPALGPCEGMAIQQVAVTLPIDRWGEAQSLAQGWLEQMQLRALLVGRIRKILGVYLVSLVHAAPPHQLAHQIAIRVSDGRVILLE